MYIDPKLLKTNYIYIKKTILLTDSGFLFQSTETKTIYKFQKFVESTSLSNDEDFMEARFVIDTEVDIVYRSYIKLWDLAANTGGIFKLLQTVCLVLSSPFTKILFYKHLEHSLMKNCRDDDSKNHKSIQNLTITNLIPLKRKVK